MVMCVSNCQIKQEGNMITIGKDIYAQFKGHLEELELSPATIMKHMRNLQIFAQYAGGVIKDKTQLNGFRDYLRKKKYASGTINSILGTVNKILAFMKKKNLCAESWHLRGEKVQRTLFLSSQKELTIEEYKRLVKTARQCGDYCLAMLLQTICATGIRVSELKAITVESLAPGQAVVRNKGKERIILLPAKLVKALRRYCRERNITADSIFVTKTGRPQDRSNIWRKMKKLAGKAHVAAEKVFPHNLRHLFARMYYDATHDIARLADLLGHSSVDTTRIYTATSSREERDQMNRLPLVLQE